MTRIRIYSIFNCLAFTVALFLAQVWSSPVNAFKPNLAVQVGHYGQINSLSFSSDRKLLASTGGDGKIHLLDLASLKEAAPIAASVSAVAFSPDSKYVAAVGDPSRPVRRWEVSSHRELPSLNCKFADTYKGIIAVYPHSSIAYSPNGRLIASWSFDDSVKVWDASTGRLLNNFKSHNFMVSSIAFSSDSKQIAAAGRSGIEIWHCVEKRRVALLSTAGAKSIAFNSTGEFFAATGVEGDIEIWGLPSFRKLAVLKHERASVISFSPNGKFLASAGYNTTAKIWNVFSQSQIKELKVSDGLVSSICFGFDNSTLAVAEVRELALWNIDKGEEISLERNHADDVTDVLFSPDGSKLAVSGFDTLKIWNLKATNSGLVTLLKSGEKPDFDPRCLDFSPDGTKLAVGDCAYGNVRVYDVSSGKIVHSFNAYKSWCNSICFSPDGNTLAISSMESNVIKLWHIPSEKFLPSLNGHTGNLVHLAFEPTGKYLFSVGTTESKMWRLDSMDPVKTFELDFKASHGSALEAKTATVAIGFSAKNLQLWNMKEGTKSSELPITETFRISFSGSKLLAAADYRGSIQLWNIETKQKIHALLGHHADVQALAFNTSGKLLASAGEDQVVKLWDVQTGANIASLYTKDEAWAVVAPSGRFDGSASGMRLLYWQIGTEVVELDQLKDRFYQPELLPILLGFSNEQLADVIGFDEVELFPAIKTFPIQKNSSQLKCQLQDRGGGVGRIVVKVNGKELRGLSTSAVSRDATSPKMYELNVDLSKAVNKIPGQINRVEISVYNANEYIVSRSEQLAWLPPGNLNIPKPHIHAIIAGVSDYKDSSLKLNFAAKDACDFAKAFELGANRLFGPANVHITLLTTAKAPNAVPPTKENIRKAFEEARKTNPHDILVVYFAGHGTTAWQNGSIYCYLTSDAFTTNLTDPQIRRKTAITSEELKEWTSADKIPALKQVIILDTCAAGELGNDFSSVRGISGDQIKALDRLNDANGFWVLMGCTADSVSYEASKYGQGLLTHSLLQGMKGSGLLEERTQKLVDISHLFAYTSEQVPTMAAGIGGVQRPQLMTPKGGTSFWIGEMTNDDMAAVPLALKKPIILKPTLMGKTHDNLRLTAALKERFYDDLVSQALSSPEKSSIANYVQADQLAGAYLPTGTYSIDGDQVTVNVGLSIDGVERQTFSITGSTNSLDDLMARTAQMIYKIVGATK